MAPWERKFAFRTLMRKDPQRETWLSWYRTVFMELDDLRANCSDTACRAKGNNSVVFLKFHIKKLY
jgi:hypothetical protein